jgi:N-acetylneuraminate synthase/N,N'-diacetyllegionaminate synthase
MNSSHNIWTRLTKKDHCFIIAEIGSNHNGDILIAKKMIDVACDAGADAVKFQFFKAEKIAADTKDPTAKIKDGLSLQQFYQTCETPRSWISELVTYCRKKNIVFFATPFDYEAVDLLEQECVELYKVASFEIVDLLLLNKIARTQKPIILSTGMADLEDIQDALTTIYSQGNSNVILLHCGINYPAPFDEVNLRAMDTIKEKFKVPVGYSDHTQGITVPIAAVARGAQVIEKHFTLSRRMEGPDHSFALEPDELIQMVKAIRECEKCLGSFEKKCTESEKIHFLRGRRSIFSARDIRKGQILILEDFSVLRPGIGLKPKYLDELIGKTSRRDLAKNEPVTWDLIR